MTTAASPELSVVRTTLRTWAATLLDLDPVAVRWEDESQEMITGTVCTLAPIAERQIGQGETQSERVEADPDGEEMRTAEGAHRILSLSVKVDGYDQRIPNGPFFALSQMAVRLRDRVSRSTLRTIGFALVDVFGPFAIPRLEGGRVYPRAALDLAFGYTRVESREPLTWIEHAGVTATLRDQDGVALASPPNGTDTIPPL